jgi:ACT domain
VTSPNRGLGTVAPVHRFVLRVWLPDRPGALGQVASRIGAVHGDVIGIEILEQGGGRAIDELVVALPDAGLIDPLVREVAQVEGVDIEWVQPLDGDDHDPQLALLEAAATLVEVTAPGAGLDELCADLRSAFSAGWCAVVERPTASIVARSGEVPSAAWIVAFLEGSRHLDAHADGGADDVAWADLSGRDRTLVLSRSGRPFRARERRQLVALARIGGVVDAAASTTPPTAHAANRPRRQPSGPTPPPAPASDPVTASEAVTDRLAFRHDP